MSDPIDVVVDKEVRRRKRNLRVFLSLLALPILTGIVALAYGGRQAAAPDVRPIVREEVRRTLEPQIATQVATQVDARLNEQVPPIVEEEVAKRVAVAMPQVNELPELRNRILELQRSNEMLAADLRRQNDNVAALSTQIGTLQRNMKRIELSHPPLIHPQ